MDRSEFDPMVGDIEIPPISRRIIKPFLNFLAPNLSANPHPHRTELSKAVILGGGWRLELWQKDLGQKNGVVCLGGTVSNQIR